MRNLTQKEVDDIPRLKADGYTTRAIARLYQVHQTAVNYWIRRLALAGHVIPRDVIGRPTKIVINKKKQ